MPTTKIQANPIMQDNCTPIKERAQEFRNLPRNIIKAWVLPFWKNRIPSSFDCLGRKVKLYLPNQPEELNWFHTGNLIFALSALLWDGYRKQSVEQIGDKDLRAIAILELFDRSFPELNPSTREELWERIKQKTHWSSATPKVVRPVGRPRKPVLTRNEVSYQRTNEYCLKYLEDNNNYLPSVRKLATIAKCGNGMAMRVIRDNTREQAPEAVVDFQVKYEEKQLKLVESVPLPPIEETCKTAYEYGREHKQNWLCKTTVGKLETSISDWQEKTLLHSLDLQAKGTTMEMYQDVHLAAIQYISFYNSTTNFSYQRTDHLSSMIDHFIEQGKIQDGVIWFDVELAKRNFTRKQEFKKYGLISWSDNVVTPIEATFSNFKNQKTQGSIEVLEPIELLEHNVLSTSILPAQKSDKKSQDDQPIDLMTFLQGHFRNPRSLQGFDELPFRKQLSLQRQYDRMKQERVS